MFKQAVFHRFWGAFLFLAALLLASCSGRRIAATLDDVETFIQERPDSALTVLRSLDTSALASRSLRAHYALLHAMALDKNWIDTPDENVIMPAVAYYDRHRNLDRRAKAWYYLGRIQENRKEPEAAIISYTCSEIASVETHDEVFLGLLDFGFMRIYENSYNWDMAMQYAEKGLLHFQRIEDTLRSAVAIGHMADICQDKREWNRADSLYKACLQVLQGRSEANRYLSRYAAMKIIQPDPDPEGAIELLRRRLSGPRGALTLKDYGVYAYASALAGDKKTCDNVLKMIERHDYNRRRQTRYMEYRIAEHCGAYEKALDILKTTYSEQDTIVAETLRQSVSNVLQGFYEKQANESERKLKDRRHLWIGILFLFFFVSGSLFILFLHRRERERQAADLLIRAAEETNRILKSDISDLQNTFVHFYQDQLSRIGAVCEAYVKGMERKDNGKKEAVYRRVEKIVEEINKDEETHARFEQQVNYYLDNVVLHLKEDLEKDGPLTKLDVRFICCSAANFDSNTMSMLLGISLSNVYTRRSRLKERIRQLESPYKEQYMRVFGVK